MSFLQTLFSTIGSHSSDFSNTEQAENPLPPCPVSPNCVRITQKINPSIDTVFAASLEILRSMQPEQINIEENNYRIDAVFKVVFFRDDLNLQLTKSDADSTYLHIRSASREGFADLGVNTRRVKRFLKRLEQELS